MQIFKTEYKLQPIAEDKIWDLEYIKYVSESVNNNKDETNLVFFVIFYALLYCIDSTVKP